MFDYLICVATVNGPKRLEDFLTSIKENTIGINYAISICDDCSIAELSQQNHDLARKYNCFYTRNENRSGVPISWNRAIQLVGAAGDSKNYIVANDDILVVPGWLHAYDAFRKANAGLNLGVVAWPATNDKNALLKQEKFTVGVDEAHIVVPIVACAGYLFGFSKQQYQSVMGFDERYFATWEEIDFGAKLCMNGFKSVGLNYPVIYHQGGASFSDPINQHPVLIKQSLAQDQWIDKWSTILNVSKVNKSSKELIIEISNNLTAKFPPYTKNDFKSIEVDLANYKCSVPIEARADIEGWFDWEELYKSILLNAPTGAHFVEVGSWMGKSACYMAEHIKKYNRQVRFDCVDIWDDNSSEAAYSGMIQNGKKAQMTLLELFKNNLKKYDVLEFVNPIKNTSAEASKHYYNNTLDLVFIDAAHDFDSVRTDLESWYPKIKSGGDFAGHDYHYSQDGVQRAVKEFCHKYNLTFRVIGQCWHLKKP